MRQQRRPAGSPCRDTAPSSPRSSTSSRKHRGQSRHDESPARAASSSFGAAEPEVELPRRPPCCGRRRGSALRHPRVEAALGGIGEIRRESGCRPSRPPTVEAAGRQSMHRVLGAVEGLRHRGVRQPARQRSSPPSGQRTKVDSPRLGIAWRDPKRPGIALTRPAHAGRPNP